MAVRGLVMAPIPLSVVACEFAAAIGFFVLLDMLKIPVFARLRIS
jgi:H+-transporting ATPase